ncbi:hypothetical protein H8958_002845, partial [Nasalis larvatus]
PNWDHLLHLECPDGVSPPRMPITHPPPLCRQGRNDNRQEGVLLGDHLDDTSHMASWMPVDDFELKTFHKMGMKDSLK